MRKRERQKNIVVGLLAVLALGTVTWTLLGSMSGRRRGPRPTPTPAAAAAASPAAPAIPNTPAPTTSPDTPTVLVPDQPIDLPTVRTQYSRWVDSPARDPFQIVLPTAPKAEGPRAQDILSLRAIWRQSGGRLAVINNLVLGEGDRIAGFSIERIEANQVWVRGTNGTEHIDFNVGGPAQPSNPGPRGSGRLASSGTTTTAERRLSP